MTDQQNDPYAPFERCGYTIHRASHLLAQMQDLIRVSRDGWYIYLDAPYYDQFDGDDTAFQAIMDTMRQRADEARKAPGDD